MAKFTEFPEEGELVVGTVTKVQNFGAFVTLDEYKDKEGFAHIREVASGWVKRIRDHIREQQRLVFKVMGVDAKKGHVDLSLKAVNDHQRRETIQSWKNEQKADKLIEMFAAKIGEPADELFVSIGKPMLGVWESLYDGLTELAQVGVSVLTDEKIEVPHADELAAFCKENIQATFVELIGFVELATRNPAGVMDIQKALVESEKSEFEDVKIIAAYKGAPVYRLEVQAPDFKIGEDQLRKAADRAIQVMVKAGGEGTFHREMEE